MIDKIIGGFFAIITAILSLFYTPTPVTQVNPAVIPEAKKTQTVTVMSYNVWIGGTGKKSPENRTDEIVSKIRKHNPDSFGLQEADEGWMERLPAELAEELPFDKIGLNVIWTDNLAMYKKRIHFVNKFITDCTITTINLSAFTFFTRGVEANDNNVEIVFLGIFFILINGSAKGVGFINNGKTSVLQTFFEQHIYNTLDNAI